MVEIVEIVIKDNNFTHILHSIGKMEKYKPNIICDL